MLEIPLSYSLNNLLSLHGNGVFSHDGGEELFMYHLGKLGDVYFDEIEVFLRNEDTDNEIRAFLAMKVRQNTILTPSIYAFLTDNDIDTYVKIKLSQRIISRELNQETLVYLRDESQSWGSRGAIAMTLRGINFSTIKSFLENEQVDINVRIALLDTVLINSTQYSEEILDFLQNQDIDETVREFVALTLEENTSFQCVEAILRNQKVGIKVRKAITAYCHFELDDNIFIFLEDETIHYEVRMSVISSLNPITIDSNILRFLKNNNIDYAVRFEFAFMIEKGEITPEILDFIQDSRYDMNIRRNLYEMLTSKVDINMEELFQKLGIQKQKQCKSYNVNQWQIREITGQNNILYEQNRTLNFYYRQAQGSFDPHFEVISECIRYYIESGYSSVWNKYRIISRHPHTKKLGDIEAVYKEMMAFRSISSIYADTIHITHGSPEVQIPGTHFILGEAITREIAPQALEFESKMDGISENQYTNLDLDYYGGNVGYFFRGNGGNNIGVPDLSIEQICSRVIDALQRAEAKILKQSLLANQKVANLLEI